MYTQCPHCQTCFRIAEAHLTAAKGMVRCGSCQSIFDATAHLSSGLPDEPAAPAQSRPAPLTNQVEPPPPAPEPAPVSEPPPPPTQDTATEDEFAFDTDDHEHIDLGLAPDRANTPDQSVFMESILDEHSAYNNLDNMGKISIPGDLSFGDSYVGLPDPTENTQEPVPEDTASPANTYEDEEKKELPASNSDRAGIYELYMAADKQIQDDEQLTQNIEELLSYAEGLDGDKPSSEKLDMHPDLADLEDFEKELDEITLASPEQPQAAPAENADTVEASTDATKPVGNRKPKPEADSKEETTRKPPSAETELPSPDYEIPKALRSSFDVLEATGRPIWQTLGMGALIVILLFGFLFQLLLFRSYELANGFPSLAPTLASLCDTLPCRYAGGIDVSQIQLQNRDVRSHPSQKNALLISAAFVNQADFRQPYPTIAIRLSDLSGHVVATRHFRPEEYLDKLYTRFLLMEPGTPVHITLAVLDPGDDAINFDFSFL